MPEALPRLTGPLAVARLLAFAALVVIAACASTLPNYDYSKEPDPRASELVLGVGDIVAINVWENTNLNTESTIRPDGTITMPLIGDVKAAGETPTSLKNAIKTKLVAYLKQVQATDITLAVKSWKSYRFTIQGEVSRPGVITSDQYVTVGDAIAMAGGLSRFAKRDEIVLMRRDWKTGKIRQIPLNYEDLASGKRPDMNIYMLAGDTIWVP
jgi:polysaccharide export outer membrane protein